MDDQVKKSQMNEGKRLEAEQRDFELKDSELEQVTGGSFRFKYTPDQKDKLVAKIKSPL